MLPVIFTDIRQIIPDKTEHSRQFPVVLIVKIQFPGLDKGHHGSGLVGEIGQVVSRYAKGQIVGPGLQIFLRQILLHGTAVVQKVHPLASVPDLKVFLHLVSVGFPRSVLPLNLIIKFQRHITAVDLLHLYHRLSHNGPGKALPSHLLDRRVYRDLAEGIHIRVGIRLQIGVQFTVVAAERRLMEIRGEIQALLLMAVIRQHNSGIVTDLLILLPLESQDKQILLSLLHKIFNLYIRTEIIPVPREIVNLRLGDLPLRVQTANLVGRALHRIPVSVHGQRKHSVRLQRQNRVAHIAGIHLPGVTMKFIHRPTAGLHGHDRQRRIPHGRSPAFPLIIQHDLKKNQGSHKHRRQNQDTSLCPGRNLFFSKTQFHKNLLQINIFSIVSVNRHRATPPEAVFPQPPEADRSALSCSDAPSGKCPQTGWLPQCSSCR